MHRMLIRVFEFDCMPEYISYVAFYHVGKHPSNRTSLGCIHLTCYSRPCGGGERVAQVGPPPASLPCMQYNIPTHHHWTHAVHGVHGPSMPTAPH